MLARQTDVVGTHTCLSRASEFGPSMSGAMSDATSSSDDEAPNIWDALLEAMLHARVGAVLQPLLSDEDMGKVALSCRFACDALCAELYALDGDRALLVVGSSSDSDEPEPANMENPLLAAIVVWLRRARRLCA